MPHILTLIAYAAGISTITYVAAVLDRCEHHLRALHERQLPPGLDRQERDRELGLAGTSPTDVARNVTLAFALAILWFKYFG